MLEYYLSTHAKHCWLYKLHNTTAHTIKIQYMKGKC